METCADLAREDIAWAEAETLAEALQHAERALAEARARGDPDDSAAAPIGVARCRFRLGQYEAARALAHEALALAGRRTPALVDAWQMLANIAAETHSLADAEACYRAALDLARENGYAAGRAAALHGLAAGVYAPRGQFDLALAALEEARALAARHALPRVLTGSLVALALICQAIGRREEARAALDEVSRLAPPGSIVEGYGLALRAALALDEGLIEGARAHLGRARSIAEATGEPWLNCAVRRGMSRLLRLAGDGPGSRAWADDALALARRAGSRHEEGKALIERSRAACLCGNEAAAEADLLEAIALLEDFGAAWDLVMARFLLAALLHRQGRPEAIAAWLEAARAITEGGYAFLLEQERGLALPLLSAYQSSADPALAHACDLLLEQLRRVPPPPLRLYTLGRWQVWQGAHRVPAPALRRRRAGELLALLLLAPGRRLTFEQVAEALFPGREPEVAQTLFHNATSALRHSLEPDLPARFPSRYLQVEEGQVSLRLPPGSQVDVEAFEAHCARGEGEQAAALYGGDLLPEHRYADWTLHHRERLSLLAQRALLAEGRFAEALAASHRVLALEPWHEEATLVGMRACVALGNVAGARRLYRRLEATLRDDLDAVPHPELQAYYRSLTPKRAKS